MKNTILLLFLASCFFLNSCSSDVTESIDTALMCTDGVQNGNETGVDCGGSCQACPTCTDGVQNGDETGVDCGSSCAPCGGNTSAAIFWDDFNRANTAHGVLGDDWSFPEGTPQNGTVMIDNNKIKSVRDESVEGGLAFALHKTKVSKTDFKVSYKVTADQNEKDFGILLHADFENQSAYVAIVERGENDDQDNVAIFKFKGQEGGELVETKVALSSGTEYTFAFSTKSGVLTAELLSATGTSVISISAEDNEFSTGEVGIALLGKDADGATYIDDFVVEEI